MSTSNRIGSAWDIVSKMTGQVMVYGYIALFMVWAGLITFSAYRIEGLDEGILAAVFLVGPGVVALAIRLREDLAGVSRGSLGETQGEVAEDYTQAEMGTQDDTE